VTIISDNVDQLAAQLQTERAELDADTLAEREEPWPANKRLLAPIAPSEELLREKKCSSFRNFDHRSSRFVGRRRRSSCSLQNRFRYILVTEFQDTNIAQLRLLQLLVNDSKNIFAVGDNDQAIYRFRGASFWKLQAFPGTFCGLARRSGLHQVPRQPHRKLSLHS